MDLLNTIKADFASKKNRTVKVPEWGNLVIHFDPLTARERVDINKGVSEGDEAGILINLLIFKAKDEQGKPLFEDNADTRAVLSSETDLSVMMRISKDMDKSVAKGAKEAKNA